jgi:hypothetical protein
MLLRLTAGLLPLRGSLGGMGRSNRLECDLRAPICSSSSSFTGIDSTGETPSWSGPARARSRSPFYLAIK